MTKTVLHQNCVPSNECTPNGVEEKNKDDDVKQMNYDEWTQPSECTLTKYFFNENEN